MSRFVSVGCTYWTDTLDWPLHARLLYLYLWSNTHVHGTSGIGRVPDRVIRTELSLSPRQLGKAWGFLEAEAQKVVRCGGWYWVVERIKHTCFKLDGEPNTKQVKSVANLLRRNDLPPELTKMVLARYRYPIDTPCIPLPVLPTESVSVSVSVSESESESPLPPDTLSQDSAAVLPAQQTAGGDVEKSNETTAIFREEWKRQCRGNTGISDEELAGFVERFPGSRVACRVALGTFHAQWKGKNQGRWFPPFADFERWLAKNGGGFERFEPSETSSDGDDK